MGDKGKDGALRVSTTLEFPELSKLESELSEDLGRKATIRIFSEEGFEKISKEAAKTTNIEP